MKKWGMPNWDKVENVKTDKKNEGSAKLIEDRKIYVRFMDKMYNRAKSVEDVINQLPKDGEQIRIITQKSFNDFAILLYIVQHKKVEQVDLAIYRIDQNSVEGLARMIKDGQIKKLNIILSSFFRASKRAETWHEQLISYAKSDNRITLSYCWNHAKVMCIKTFDNEYFVIEGSGNLSDNARIEQYLFEQCKETYDFHVSWMNDLSKSSTKAEFSKIKTSN